MKNSSPMKAIREKCLDCCCNSYSEVTNCPSVKCPLHPFRFGKNPYIKRELTEDQKIKMSERMKKARESKGERK